MSKHIGKTLYDTVVEYSSLGEHRSGTPVDHATIDWFAQKLESLGGKVEKQPYEFDRYDVDWEVEIGGEKVVSIPLFYEGVGDVRTDQPTVGIMKVSWGTFLPENVPLISMAGGDGGRLHHAPEDIPELATTPDILEALFQGALSAAKLLIPCATRNQRIPP